MAFVIRSFPRSGTHMLRTSLNKHPLITCHNEVFHPDITPAIELRSKPIKQLYAEFTGEYTGFVAHGYSHLERYKADQVLQDLWVYLCGQPVKIIVLERKDQLRRAFSVFRSLQSQRWHMWKRQQGGAGLCRPRVEASSLEYQLRTSLMSQRLSRILYPDAYYVTYEELADNWHARIMEMQEIIGVPEPLPVEPLTAKQDKRPIAEMVSNYQELKDVFKYSEYAEYFDYAEQADEHYQV